MLRTVRASHAPLTRRPDPPHLSVLVVRPAAGAQTLLAAFARRRADRAGRGDALAHARRRRAVRGARVGGSSRCTSAGTSRAAVPRCFFVSSSSLAPSPVFVLVWRLLFGRRALRSEGAARAGRRATRAARVHRGWLSPPQLSRDIARRGVFFLLLFSRPVAGRRPRLASSLRSPLRAERGRDARGATGDARATRASRVYRGWLSPPQLSRDIARRGGPLLLVLFSRPVRRSARAPLLRSTRAPAGRARTTSGRVNARRAQRDGRSARGVRARHALGARGPRFRAPGVCVSGLCCSPLPALRARRSVLSLGTQRREVAASERATHAVRDARDAPGARGARAARSVGVNAACAVFVFCVKQSNFGAFRETDGLRWLLIFLIFFGLNRCGIQQTFRKTKRGSAIRAPQTPVLCRLPSVSCLVLLVH
jgi:hypothetical protein